MVGFGRRAELVEYEVGHAPEHEGVAHVAEGLDHRRAGRRRPQGRLVAPLVLVAGIHVAVVVQVAPRVVDGAALGVLEPGGVGLVRVAPAAQACACGSVWPTDRGVIVVYRRLRRALACRSCTWVMLRAARRIILSSSAWLKVLPSAVPWTSTKAPEPVMATLKSTSAALSSG